VGVRLNLGPPAPLGPWDASGAPSHHQECACRDGIGWQTPLGVEQASQIADGPRPLAIGPGYTPLRGVSTVLSPLRVKVYAGLGNGACL